MPDDFEFLDEKQSRTEEQDQAPWWHHPPTTIDEALYALQSKAAHLKDKTEEGVVLRKLLEFVEKNFNNSVDLIRQQYPIAFFKPSYEQSLLLNCWIWGFDFVVVFAANRIGKTTCMVINSCLWIFPNHPDWEMFTPRRAPNPKDQGNTFIDNPDQANEFYRDTQGRIVQVLQRPYIEHLDEIRETLKTHPQLIGDPYKSHLDKESGNAHKFATLQRLCPKAFNPAWPSGSLRESGSIWLGAPDQTFHRDIILKEWKAWLPRKVIKKWSETDLFFEVSNREETNPNPVSFRCICKSYESDDTKWSGSAVQGIVLTEGLTEDVLNEIKQRIKVHGFGSWDYTPYESRNVGAKTALAHKVFKGEEQLPLSAKVFTNFSARNAPAHILPTSKRDDLIRMWDGKKEGEARLDGKFFATSPMVLSKLERSFHCIPWTFDELKDRFPLGQLYRGFDPGYDHPSVCCWGMLTPGNVWYIYRYWSARGHTISERCEAIITLSNNSQKKRKYGSGPSDYILTEVHNKPNSEVFNLTATDFHLFKQDEVTGNPYSLNYIKEGLVVTESTHMRPEDRALELDRKLTRDNLRIHPITRSSPGCSVFFLINGEGVDLALGKMEALFWDRLQSGQNKNEPKDKVPTHRDDELDATSYLVCGPYTWSNYRPAPNNKIDLAEEDKEFFARLQTA